MSLMSYHSTVPDEERALENQKCIVFLCQDHELTRERRGYYKALQKRIRVLCAPPVIKNGYEHLDDLLPRDLKPILIIQPDATPRLPRDIVASTVPTASFEIDTYSGTDWRLKWAMLFDYAYVFHPAYVDIFKHAGHPRPVCLPHAVEADLFETLAEDRMYEVGWVGNLKGVKYSMRRLFVGGLRSRFRMNDLDRYYSLEELAELYKSSKVVVNVSRDDYLQDANLRCFEVMASGALLVTHRPTELSQLGFKEGEHFIGFSGEGELYESVGYYLKHDDERIRIAHAGRALVMKEHTYDKRAETLLKSLEKDDEAFHAPARNWEPARVMEVYIHYYAKHLMLDDALREMGRLRRMSRRRAFQALPLIGQAFLRSLQSSLL